MNKVNKNTVRNVLIISTVFIFFLGLAYMFPYTGDDWAWGGSLGLERLHNNFKDYNGRYLGNLLVIALTRSNILKSVVMSGVMTGTVYLIYRTVKNKSTSVLLLALIGLLVMPRYIFRQSIVWTSGFTNYAVPTTLIISYICIIKSIFDGKPKFHKAIFTATFVLGVCAALFMENITLYQIAMDIIIVIGTLFFYKKVFAPVLSHLFGSIIGCIIMFSNGAYLNILNSNDGYRTMETTSGGMLSRIKENLFDVISKELTLNNVLLNILITVVCIILVMKFIKGNKHISAIRKFFIYINLFIVISYTVYSISVALYQGWNIVLNYTKYFNSIFMILFGLSLLILSFISVTDVSVKLRLGYYVLSIAILTAPLFVVTPIGSRCFFCSYMFFILFICEVFGYVFDQECEYIRNGVFSKALISVCLCFAIYYLSIFGYIFLADKRRDQYVSEQLVEGKVVIEVPELPYQGYLWNSTPDPNTVWCERYKDFKGIDQSIEFEIIRYSEWRKSIK